MKESFAQRPEFKERLQPDKLSVIVIGDACSGKTTLLDYLRLQGFSVRPEPENKMFNLFLKDQKHYAYHNQLYKTTQLMEQELQGAASERETDPYFNESGVLATDIYNRYLRDQDLMTADQFEHLNGVYTHYLDTMPKPGLVVYLYADDATIRDRAIKRDGRIAHDPEMLTSYWDRLLADLEHRGIPVMRVNTGAQTVDETSTQVIAEAERLKRERSVTTPVVAPLPVRPEPVTDDPEIKSMTLSFFEVSVEQ